MNSEEDKTPQQQQEEGDTDPDGRKKRSSKSDSLFPLPNSSRKAQKRQVQSKFYDPECELQELKTEAEDDSEETDVAEKFCRSKCKTVYQECPNKLEKFPGKFFNRWELWVRQYKYIVELMNGLICKRLRPFLLV